MNSIESVNFSSAVRRGFVSLYILERNSLCNSCKAGSLVKVHSLQTAQVKKNSNLLF